MNRAECRTTLITLTKATRDKEMRQKIDQTLDAVLRNRSSFLTSHIQVMIDHIHGYMIRVD